MPPRNHGGIPPYGKHFRLESTPWHPEFAGRVYALKLDGRWFLRSDKASKTWRICYGADRLTAITIGRPCPSMTAAMTRLLDGIAQGFYQAGG